MKKNMYAIIDTETANGLKNPMCYDVAVIIFDKKGNEYFRKNWLVKNVWNNTKMMDSAYYSWKRPLYEHIEHELVNTYTFITELNSILEQYEVNYLLAYNLAFDIRSISKTVERYTYNLAKHLQKRSCVQYPTSTVLRRHLWGSSPSCLRNSH